MSVGEGLFYSKDAEIETLNKRIRPSDDQLGRLRDRKDELIAHLKRDLPSRCGVAISTWLQGSYKFHTLIRPLSKQDYDVDVGVYFEWGRSSSVKLTVSELRDELQRSVQDFAANDEHVKSVEDPAKDRCSRAYYAKRLHIDLPGYHSSTDTGETRLATMDGTWEASDPEKMVAWFQVRLDGDERAQARRVVRYLKAWSALHFEGDRDAQPSSLMLTVLATDAFVDAVEGLNVGDDEALKLVVEEIFARLSASVVVENPVDSDQDRNLNRLSNDGFVRFSEALGKLRGIGRSAVAADNEADAAAIWTEAFDYLIPLPDVEGMAVEDLAKSSMVLVTAPTIRVAVSAERGGVPRQVFTNGQVDLAYRGEWLRFYVTNRDQMPPHAEIRWVVRNIGKDAYDENDLGHSEPDQGAFHDEHAAYHGRHFMDCEVRVNGRLHALTRIPVAITRTQMPPRHPVRRPAYTRLRFGR
jgi:hypothetical protein